MLTPRELAVRKLRTDGKTQVEVAKLLKVSQPAVSAFERSAARKITDAQTLLTSLKKAGLLSLLLCTILTVFSAPVSAVQYITPLNSANQSIGVSDLLYLDNTNLRIGVAVTNPQQQLVVPGSVSVSGTSFLTTVQPQGASDSLSFIANSQTGLFLNGTTGFVGVGMNNATTNLQIDGSIQSLINGTTLRRVGNLTLGSGENLGNKVAVSGRYAYIAAYNSPARLVIVDITNPSNPARVGNITLQTGEDYAASLAVNGRYVYITTDTTPTRIITVDISNPSNPVRVGNITLQTGEDNAYDIAVSGPYAYVTTTTFPARLIALDISDPSSPVRIGNLTLPTGEEYAFSIEVSGPYAYITTSDTPAQIIIVNISNPRSPLRVANITLQTGENSALSTVVIGRYAYVATSTNPTRLVIVDISNSSNPARVGNITLDALDANSRSLAVSGRYAYVSTSTFPARLVIVDISNPSSPVRVGNATASTGEDRALSVAVSGRYAYITTWTSPTRLVVVELPGLELASAEIGSLEAGQLSVLGDVDVGQNIDVRGGVTVGPGGLNVQGDAAAQNLAVNGSLNVSGTTTASRICLNGDCRTSWPWFVSGTGNLTSNATSADGYIPYFTNTTNIDKTNLYWNTNTSRLGVGLTNPQTTLDVNGSIKSQIGANALPTRLGNLTLGSGDNLARIWVSGKTAYIVTFTSPSRLIALDVSNPSNVSQIGNITLATNDNSARTIAVFGQYAYISIGTSPGRLVVVDVSNPSNMTRVGAVDFPSGENSGRGMAVNGRYVYITTNTNPAKFLVFDVSNPANPWRVGGINLNSGEDQGRAIAVSGKYAYVTGNTAPAFFTVIDMSSPAAPTRVGGTTLEVGNELSGQAIAISGRYAFAAMNTDPTVLTAIDISNPTAPTRVSRFEGTLGVDLATSSLSLNGKYAYIISDSSPTRVSIIDVSNASSLVRVANFTLPTDENGSRVFVSGRYAYFASGTSPIRFSAYELPGLETATAEIGSLEAGTLSVSGSLSVQQNLNVDSLTVGPGGLLVQGDAAADSFIANGSFEIPNRFLVNVSSNRVEFGSRALNTTLFVNGSINATGAITSSGGFDLAEAFSADEPLLPGELVVATSRHSVRKATAETAHLVLGAVSTQPGFLLDRADIPNRVFIGLSGRVPVSVEGDVRPGDFITASSTPGKGRAATSAGFVIGRAISSVQADGTVLTIIQPMYFSPQVTARGTLLGANAARVYTQTGASSEETVVRTAESVTIALAQSDVVVTLG